MTILQLSGVLMLACLVTAGIVWLIGAMGVAEAARTLAIAVGVTAFVVIAAALITGVIK